MSARLAASATHQPARRRQALLAVVGGLVALMILPGAVFACHDPSVVLAKTADAATVQPGGTLGFTITATAKSDWYTETVTVTDTLPAGYAWTIDTANSSSGCAISGGVLTCNWGRLDGRSGYSPKSKSVHVTAPATGPTCGTVSNTAGGSYMWLNTSTPVSVTLAQKTATSKVICSPAINTVPAPAVGFVGDTIHDTAQVTGGSSPTGSVSFWLFPPSDASCTGTPVFTSANQPLTNGAATSGNHVTTVAGTYHWKATYNGDANNASVTSPCSAEPVVISRYAPRIRTSLTGGTATGATIDILPGTSVTDLAILGDVTADAGGTVTYAAYSDAACKVAVPNGSSTKTVAAGVVPASDPVVLNAEGSYYWIASYSGDDRNDPAVSGCGEEIATVAKTRPSITTALSGSGEPGAHIAVAIGTAVSDQATLSGATADAGGTVAYTVYSDTTCLIAFRSAGTKDVIAGVAGASDAITFASAGTYYWQAAYSGDAKNAAVTSGCQEESVTVGQSEPGIFSRLNGQAPHISVPIGTFVTDTATLTGLVASSGELTAQIAITANTVTFTVYRDATCSGAGIDAGTVPVVNGSATSNPILHDQLGTYYWQASYSGDANNRPILHPCTAETATVREPDSSPSPTPSPEPSTPSFPPTPCEILGTCPTPSPTPTPVVTPTPEPTPTATPAPTGEVNPATGAPEGGVLPETNGGAGPSGPASNQLYLAWVLLLGTAAILIAAGTLAAGNPKA